MLGKELAKRIALKSLLSIFHLVFLSFSFGLCGKKAIMRRSINTLLDHIQLSLVNFKYLDLNINLLCCVSRVEILKCSIFLFKSEFTTAIAHSVLDIFNSRMFRYILNRCKDWFCMRCFGKTTWLSGDMKALNNVTRISLERFSYFQIVCYQFLHAQYLFC